LKYNLFDFQKANYVITTNSQSSFGEFVDVFGAEKIAAAKVGDLANKNFAKLISNSAYGKTGQRGDAFFDWEIYYYEGERPSYKEGWVLSIESPFYEVWKKPAPKPYFYNVGIAASVTGAARAVLMEGIHKSERVAYCDTDSIICEYLDMPLHETNLGAWDLEGSGQELNIAGKKLYSLFNGEECTKKASKGVRLSGECIRRASLGAEIDHLFQVPSFGVLSPPQYDEEEKEIKVKFLKRTVKKSLNNPFFIE